MAAKEGKPTALDYDLLHDRNLGNVKLLIETVIPVRYSPEFYKMIVKTPFDFTKLAYYNSVFVGFVGSRTEGEGSSKKLYIMVLAVLAPYRDRGIGSAMLKEVLQNVSKHPDIKEVYMHVQSNNEAALRFYERHGFDKGELVEGYYRGIEPSSAYVVRKAVNGAAPAAVGAGAGAGAAPAVTSS